MTIIGGSTTTTNSSLSQGTSIELVENNQEIAGHQRRSALQKCGLLLGGAIVGAVIAVLILLAVIYSAPSASTPSASVPPSANASAAAVQRWPPTAQPMLQLDDYLSGLYYPTPANGTWISGHELLYRDEFGNFIVYDARQRKSALLLSNETGDVMQAVEYRLSPDRRFMLISKNVQRIFRHSTFAFYDAIDLQTKQIYAIAQNRTADFLQLVEWSTQGNALVFVQANNIFYKPSVESAALPITSDGDRSIGYGTCDWVYEEEVFASKTALWFSPDGRRLAFVRFDDTLVPLMNIPVYGEPGRLDSQYPQSIGLHYPKVGAPNPLVSLHTVDLQLLHGDNATLQRHEQRVPQALRNAEHIISAVGWQNNDTFVSVWMNRVQNRAHLQRCRDSNCTEFASLVSSDGWLDLFKTLRFNANGSAILLVAAHEQPANAGRFRHVTLMSTDTGVQTPLTSGSRFEVCDIEHYDAASNRLFYMATQDDRPETQQLWTIRAEAGATAQCLSCALPLAGGNQTYFNAAFSPGRFAIVSSEGPSVPHSTLYEWSPTNGSDAIDVRPIVALETNGELQEMLRDVALPHVSYLDVPLDNGNFSARVRLMVPANLDRSGRTKYPMLVNVYAGPDSYNGYDRFDLGWSAVQVSTRSIIHVQINGRGSGHRGDRLRHAIYRRFGQVEVDDQLEVTRKLVERLPYVDGGHVAIWGWSYGGFSAAMALAKDEQRVFRCAASVAPVTDFALYDSIYTERFMGLPTVEDNAAGYAEQRILLMPEHFRNRTFLLVHGTFDDNVHFQQSMLLSRSLELHDIMFRQMSYPDEGHSLQSVQRHLYHTLGQYFDECLFEV